MAIGVVALALAVGFGFRGETFEGVVIRIIDGDTVAFQGDGSDVTVRLWGVDAPEMDQVWGIAAKGALGELCIGEKVQAEVKNVDRYRRRVCKMKLPDGRDVGEEMVKRGAAWWSRKYAPREDKLRSLESSARDKKIGLWANPPCIDPAEFRRNR